MKFGVCGVALVLLGIFVGKSSSDLPPSLWIAVRADDVPKADATTEFELLKGEVERLKNVVPDQAHAMHDVDYHFTNLWFAATQGHWPLAEFYLNETRSHLRWAVRIIPVRKDNQGLEVRLEDILQSVENGPLKQVEEAIKQKDPTAFTSAYEFTLTGCYGCHKSSEKPYLRPRIPDRPATSMISFDPHAEWPK